MGRLGKVYILLLVLAALLTGCTMATIEDLYSPPKRSAEFEDLQRAIDNAMQDMEYASPQSGENRQTVQMADLDGDGVEEYLLFARDTSDNPMKIMIFTRDASGCNLTDTIESRGSGFDVVEYLDLDGRPGLEIVVGRQISNMILRSMSVYTYEAGAVQQLMTASYTKFVSTDLDNNDIPELMVITGGESDEDNAVAALYRWENGEMTRSREASLSQNGERIKRIMVSKLHGQIPAVYVASSVEDSAIITDVFALKDGHFTNVSFSNESGTSVQTLRNYYVYADDIDDDGILELPDLIDMKPVENTWRASNQQLIRWYSMTQSGGEVDKMYTFHNFDGGWYLQLDRFLTPRITVIQKDHSYEFHLWDEDFQSAQVLMTIHALTGANREQMALERGYYILQKMEGVLYAVETEKIAAELGLMPELLAASFHPIQMDWKNGET